MRRIVPLMVAMVMAALPAAGQAQTTTNAPPGNSGISQYLEVVPTASGSSSSKSARDRNVKPSKTLQQAGKDGVALQQYVAGSAAVTPAAVPSRASSKSGRKTTAKPTTTDARKPTGTTDELHKPSSRKALAAAFTGGGGGNGGGLGVPLLIPMLITAVVVGLMAFGARRRHPDLGPGA